MEKQTIIDNGLYLIDKFRNVNAEAKSFILSAMKQIEKIMVYEKFDDMGDFEDTEEAFDVITNNSPIITICDFNVEDCYIVGLEYDKISDMLLVYVTNENDVTSTKAIDFLDVFSDSYGSIVEFIVDTQKE